VLATPLKEKNKLRITLNYFLTININYCLMLNPCDKHNTTSLSDTVSLDINLLIIRKLYFAMMVAIQT